MSENHAKIIAELEQCCFPEDHWSETAVRETLGRSDAVYGLEYDDGSTRPVGYFIGAANQWEAELYRIAVVPEYRGKGIGKRLMKAFLESCREKAERIFLEVREGNSAAIGLYKSCGFSAIGVRKRYYGNEDGIIMEMKTD